MADILTTIFDAIGQALSSFYMMTLEYLPNILGAILLFLIGLYLGKRVKTLTIRILDSIQFDAFAEKSNLNDFFRKAEFKSKIEDVIGGILKWFIILLFTITAINVLGVPTLSSVLNNILGYIPQVLSAIFVLAVGILLAGLVEKLVKGAVAPLDPRMGRLLGKISSYIMVVFTAMAAFAELGIAEELINALFIGLVAMLALAFGLAFGLGAKDVVKSILTDWYERFKIDVQGSPLSPSSSKTPKSTPEKQS